MFFYSNPKQVQLGKDRLLEIDSLGAINDPELKANVEKERASVMAAAARKFRWPGVGYLAGRVVLWFVIFFIIGLVFSRSEGVAMLGILVETGVIGYFAYIKMFPYGWMVNKELGGEASTKTGLQ